MQGLGFPDTCPVYFSVDFDASLSQQAAINEYLQGAGSVLGLARIGVYGGINVVTRCKSNRTASWFWQTYAWSAGKVSPFAHVYQWKNTQTINGAGVDYDRALQANYGQWAAPGSAGPAIPTEKPMSTVVLNPAIVGTLTVKPDPLIRWVDLATSTLMGPPGVNFGSPPAVAGRVSPAIGTEADGYQVTINGKASFMLSRNVTFTPAPKADSVAIAAAIDVDRLKAFVSWKP